MFLELLFALSFALYPAPLYTIATNSVPSILVDIAWCESNLTHFDSKGRVLTNKTHDYGYFQINKMHIPEAKKMGLDIMTEEGNIAYALYLYHTQGTKPWLASKGCWSNMSPPSNGTIAIA